MNYYNEIKNKLIDNEIYSKVKDYLKDGGTCVYKDDASEILEKMIKADILASLIYFYSISGQMKTLIDRTYAKFNLLSNKEFYFILSCALFMKNHIKMT